MVSEPERKRVVLVVDDHAPLRTLCRVNLEAAGFRVLEAGDGDEALACIADDSPDLILLDIMMPRVSGWQVAAALVADPLTDRIPIIFITARGGIADRIRALEYGAQDYLVKPFDPSRLADTITTVLEQIERGERDANLAEALDALRAEQALAAEGRHGKNTSR
jgi:two-component system, OmpR family, phosphate regulon response regulator PhoB